MIRIRSIKDSDLSLSLISCINHLYSDLAIKSFLQYAKEIIKEDGKYSNTEYKSFLSVALKDNERYIGLAIAHVYDGSIQIDTYVEPEHRRKYIGSSLVKNATALAQQNCWRPVIGYPIDEIGRKFYRRLGIEIKES